MKKDGALNFGAVVVPLYGLTCDAERLRLSNSAEIAKYEPEQLEHLADPEGSRLLRLFELYPPQFLLWVEAPSEQVPAAVQGKNLVMAIPTKIFGPSVLEAEELIRALRLFKCGEFRRGPTWILITGPVERADPLTDLSGGTQTIYLELTVSDMAPNRWVGGEGGMLGPPQFQSSSKDTYRFGEEELPFFQAFAQQLQSILKNQRLSRKLSLALAYYNKSYAIEWPAGQLLDLVTCLESLVLDENDELSYRLALRCANLLGTDGVERTRICEEIKQFYDVRCKIVHGDSLRDKQEQRLDQIGSLREYVRRVLL